MASNKREKRNRHFAREAQQMQSQGNLQPESRTGRRYAKKTANTLAAIGVKGLKYTSGRIQEDWRNEFKVWWRAVKHYLEMRDDVIIGTLLDAVKLPLLSATFSVEPSESNTPGDQAAADWLYDTMHRMHRQAWKSYIADALECLDFGWAIGEIVLEKRVDGRMWIRNIEPRGQETLERWDFSEDKRDEVEAMIQRDPNTGKILDPIPLSKCVHITFRGRKGNPEGRSLLYSLYKPWRFCKDFENFEGIGIERDVGGMPVAELPEGNISTDDETDLEKALVGMRRDENEYLILPPGVKIEPYGASSKMYDIGAVIERKKKEILMRMFAQFLMLGMEQVGTQALIQGSQDFFYLALIAIQDQLIEALNQQLVPYVFQWNSFAGMTDYPTITCQPPGKVDVSGILGAVNTAVGAKIFTPTDVDEDHLREILKWPELPEDERGAEREVEQPPMEGIFTPKKVAGVKA